VIFSAMSFDERVLWVATQPSRSSFAPTFSETRTGTLKSIASRHEMPNGSWTDGMTKMSACVRYAFNSSRGAKPENMNESLTPRISANCSRLFLLWPSPTMMNLVSG